ncbi:glycosyltransferase family 4 protein [Rhizobium leguminosarum]|uniref:glycosyltransferase family 4 protein n=1 Tax=Rhizobium leguminosarum TaxID=384 RepID=UPI00041726FD|nr:glycosyltransferase family 1 protein [Rhizobium leguminosarum]
MDSRITLRRKRIGFYLGVGRHAGGMFQYAQSLVQALSSIDGTDVEVIVAYGDEAWRSELNASPLKAVPLQRWKRGETLAKLFMVLPGSVARVVARWVNPLVREMASLQCDLWIFPAQDALTWQIKEPSIATIHDLMHRYERSFPEAGSWLRFQLRESRFRHLANQSAAVLVDSETGRRHVMESYGTPEDHIYPLPYIAPNYLTDSVEAPAFAERYRLPEKFYFYPAQFWPHKNHLRLIQALAAARRTHPDMELVLAGNTKREYAAVKAMASELGLSQAVHFVGYVPDSDLAGFYRRARGLVMPTFFGPTNIPPLEAMVCGCPVLISDKYGMREQCGDAALYFSPQSVEEIQGAMSRLWEDEDLRSSLIKKGLERASLWKQEDFDHRLREILGRVLDRVA